MNKAYASCPASLSFIFKVCPAKNPLKMGSVGVGCTIDREVEVSVERSNFDEVIFDGTTINLPTVYSVVKKLAPVPVRISITSSLPLGYGFGISGAAALGTAFAINKLFDLRKMRTELVRMAHTAEIENHTGLGSVATQITGGFLMKKRPGIPVEAWTFPFAGKQLYVVMIDRLESPSILADKNISTRINKAASSALTRIRKIKNISLEKIIDISFHFAKESKLLVNQEVKSAIDSIRKFGGHATMSMLGQVVITDLLPRRLDRYVVEQLTITSNHI